MNTKRTLRAVLPFLALFLTAFAQKHSATVRFYVEADPGENDEFTTAVQLQYPPRAAFVQKVPVISERDIEAILPSRADDGTMRCVFKLDPSGTAHLDSVSVEKRGKSLVAVVDGRQVTEILIDRRVSDGIIMIPSGLTDPEILLLTKKFPVLKFRHKQEVEPPGAAGIPGTALPQSGD